MPKEAALAHDFTPVSPVMGRPEYRTEVETANADQITVADRPLSIFETLYNDGFVRKTAILIVLALVWESYGRYLSNDLLFPTFSATAAAFFEGLVSGELPARAWGSMIGFSSWSSSSKPWTPSRARRATRTMSTSEPPRRSSMAAPMAP